MTGTLFVQLCYPKPCCLTHACCLLIENCEGKLKIMLPDYKIIMFYTGCEELCFAIVHGAFIYACYIYLPVLT